MRILSLNINDFGGSTNHLQNYKKINWVGKEVTDWLTWKNAVDKTLPYKSILAYIKKLCPSIIIVQEFEVNNSQESYDFIEELQKDGYKFFGNVPTYKASITVVFSKEKIEEIENPNTLSGRSFAFKAKDIIIYGTHFPPKGIERIQPFGEEVIKFYDNYSGEKTLLIGDFNLINNANKETYVKILDLSANDIWIEKGFSDNTPTCGEWRMDVALSSPSLTPYIKEYKICPVLMQKNATDHAALILEIDSIGGNGAE